MTVIIKFRNASDWHKANWVYRQLSSDVIAQSPEDQELKFIMQQGGALGLLSLDKLEHAASGKIIREIRRVVEATLQNKIPGWKETKPNDLEGQRMYLESLSELLELIKTEVGSSPWGPRVKGTEQSTGSE